ncbi:hypothetical protein DQ04_03621030 [Trypanosoma grayi]|uniref:hypothetical protein n=1 Tax=Trypanosoma grayi TaxID=71804 RepID=UPI0004F3FEA4|nr:hypothetical protein DQ04_03621030 [Trypanosoma grayi]KEG10518.1 hypothetical protein DQ04_03621030 [Trypanosoma grayi]
MDVFLPEEIALDDVVALGRLVQEALQMALRERANSTTSTSTGMDQARVLVNRMNITHCEVPPLDEGGFVFDAMGGATIDADEAERIVQRWQERGGD